MLGYFDIVRYFKYITRQKYEAIFLENDLMIIYQRYNNFNRGFVISQKLFFSGLVQVLTYYIYFLEQNNHINLPFKKLKIL